jgi:hypothetical protein
VGTISKFAWQDNMKLCVQNAEPLNLKTNCECSNRFDSVDWTSTSAWQL